MLKDGTGIGEKSYNGNGMYNPVFTRNPYQYRTISPYLGNWNSGWQPVKQPNARAHATWITQTIDLNNSLNKKAQDAIDAREPKICIWEGEVEMEMGRLSLGNGNGAEKGSGIPQDVKNANEKGGHGFGDEKRNNGFGDEKKGKLGHDTYLTPTAGPSMPSSSSTPKVNRFSSFKKSIGIKSTEERQVIKHEKASDSGAGLRKEILDEEQGRWPDEEYRAIVKTYQDKTGMAGKIAHLRLRFPIQYLHLLRAGYFEPIPVAWAGSNSNPLKFSIEASTGWRGLTPSWRGYEDTAEERLYWVMNHREGSTGLRMKPDFISALDLARKRMDSAVPPPPEYYDPSDTCHTQHITDGYSKQVMPPPFRPFDRPESANDDTMILLDVSGSMDFKPQRPRYDRYLITDFENSTQPKNKGESESDEVESRIGSNADDV
jgi:hypothetical protein